MLPKQVGWCRKCGATFHTLRAFKKHLKECKMETRNSYQDLDYVCCDCQDFLDEIKGGCDNCPVAMLKDRIKEIQQYNTERKIK